MQNTDDSTVAIKPENQIDLVDLPTGQTMLIEHVGDTTLIRVESSSGTLIRLRVNEDCAEILLNQKCEIKSTGDLTLEAENLKLRAREELQIESNGDANIDIRGDLNTIAREQTIRSKLGNVNVRANDNVDVRGERIQLNT